MRTRHCITIGLVLAAAALSHSGTPDASAATASMQFRVVGGLCDNAQTPTICDVGLGNTFWLYVDLPKAPGGGYVGIQTEITYGGLTYLPTTDADAEIVWPDAALALRSPPSPTGTEGQVNHGATTLVPSFPISTSTGAVLKLDMQCTSGTSSQAVTLVPLSMSNTDGSGVKLPSGAAVALSDTLWIDCMSGVPSFTLLTLRAGEHVVWECEPGQPHYHSLLYHYSWGDVGDSTGTSIPPPMSIYQEPSPALAGLECWHGGTGTRVWYYVTTWIDPNDIKGHVVDAGTGIPIQAMVTLQKNVSGSWVNVTSSTDLEPDANPTSTTSPGLFGWDVAAGPQYRVVASNASCPTGNSGPLTPPAQDVTIALACVDSDGDGIPDVADYFWIYTGVFTTEDILLPDNPDTDGDTIPDGADDCDGDGYSNLVELAVYRSNPCRDETYDSDGDGCSDMEEMQGNAQFGGRRDSRNPWDFFDTDGDQTIGLFDDILEIAERFGKTPSDAEYATAYDRSPAAPGGDPWDLGAPDGTIDLFTDVLGASMQFGHDCSAAP